MLSVTHTITSAAIGAQVGSVPFAFSLAFLFHLFADTLLHWNIYTHKHRWAYAWVGVDILGGLLLAAWLAGESFSTAPVLAAIVGGNLPDLWHGSLELFEKIRRRALGNKGVFFRFHEGLQHETYRAPKGLLWQGVFLAISAWVLRS